MGDSHGSARASDTTATAVTTSSAPPHAPETATDGNRMKAVAAGTPSARSAPTSAAYTPQQTATMTTDAVASNATWDRTDVFDADGDASSVSPPPTRVTTAPAAASSPSSALDAVASAHATPEIGAPGTRRPDSKRTPAPAGSST